MVVVPVPDVAVVVVLSDEQPITNNAKNMLNA